MEAFSIKKLFDLSPIGFTKVIGLGFKALILALLVLGVVWVKNFLFPTPSTNINKPVIRVESGGQLTYTVEQKSAKERKWYVPSPFVEVFGEKTDKNEGINVGARFGARWEF